MSISHFGIWYLFVVGENMNRLKELREDKDIIQKDIARILGITQTGYSKYEVETNDIPTDVLKKLAKFYNTSIDYLLYLTDEIKPYPKSIMDIEKTSSK